MSTKTERGHVVDHREAFDYDWGREVGGSDEVGGLPADPLKAAILAFGATNELAAASERPMRAAIIAYLRATAERGDVPQPALLRLASELEDSV